MSRTLDSTAVSEHLDKYFTKASKRRAKRGRPEPQILVQAPNFEYVFGDRALPFHAASVGKLATAVLVMQLVESGELSLDAPVESLLPADEIRGLFEAPGATVEQLLCHMSGVPDYFEGAVTGGPHFIELVTGHPDRAWSPSELLEFSRSRQKPHWAPGKGYLYSDTGYVLLGRILEERTGRSFTELLRERVFTPAEMNHTVLYKREPGPERIAPAWLNGVEISTFESITCDWAGGGLVSTLDDLAALVRALDQGILVKPETWANMTTTRERFKIGIHYGLGAMELRFEGFMPLLRGLPRPVGHIGVLGVHAFIEPASKTVVVLNFHDNREMVSSFQSHIRIIQLLGRVA